MIKEILAVFNFKENMKGLNMPGKVISILIFPAICLMWWGLCMKKYWKNL